MSLYESKTNKNAQLFQGINGAIFVLISIVCIMPILHVVSASFSSKEAIMGGKVGFYPVGFTFEAYQRIFADLSFIKAFGFTILLTLTYTLCAMILTILAAYPLSKSYFKGRKILMALIVLTMYFDPGIIPNYLNVKNFGLLNSPLALIIPGLLSAYNLIILRTFFTTIDNSLYEAAHLDGCNEFQTLSKIALPLTLPAIATLSLFYAVSRWNGVSDVLFYINDPRYYTVQMKLKQMLDTIELTAIEANAITSNLVAENIKSAAIVFSMIPMLIAYPFIQKYFTKGIMIGSVKG